MIDTIATYGPAALAWVLAALGTLLSTYVIGRMRAGYVRDALQRAWLEVQGAVLEVAQTYAGAIKEASRDGTLTDEEKAKARSMAVDIAKKNLGAAGLKRLGRAIGVDVDTWLGSKVEQAVAVLKTPPAAAPLPSLAMSPPLPA